jgi:tetratricopeptide (TPR) repeat protein
MRFAAPRASAGKFAKALAQHKRRRLQKAELTYAAILKRDPGHIDALHRLGLIKKAHGRNTEAYQLLTAALARCSAAPDGAAETADTHIKRGDILQALGRHFEALVSFDRALTLAPGRADCHVRRGFALYYLNRVEAALASYDQALALAPNDATILLCRAQTLRQLDRCEEALAVLDQVLALKPDHAPALTQLGETLSRLNRYDEALAHFELAARRDPKYLHPRWGLAITRLLQGDFRRGWREYECRWLNENAEPRDFRAPLWLGEESLEGKTILLHAEQGFGDTMQFVRYAALVADRGAKVILEVQAELKTLMSRIDGVAEVLGQPEQRTRDSRIDGAPVPLAAEQDLPPFDYHCPLLSLPLAFKTDLDTVPAKIPYLRADPERLSRWQARLAQRRRPLIGLAWAGNPFHWHDRHRSIAFNLFAPLLSEPFTFVSLQKKVPDADAKLMAGVPNLVHFGDELADFDDTAAIIAALDLVVTIDTAVAHLAGAMGKPTWILLPHAPEWRWMLDREDTPWYPTMRLFRQHRLGDWKSVIERVRVSLSAGPPAA